MNKSDIEKEIDAIRLVLYEQTKHMTASERSAFFNNEVAVLGEKYGFKTVARDVPSKLNEVDKKTS